MRPINLAQPINRQHPLARGLESLWLPLQHNFGGLYVRDLAGRKHGTLNGGPTWADGPNGQRAIALDGTDDYIGCGEALPLTNGVAAFACWYKRGAADGANQQVLICNGGNNYRLYVSSTSNSFTLAGEFTPYPSLAYSVDLTSGWRLLGGQRTAAGNFELYLDGVLVAGPTSKQAATSATGNLEIGRFSGSTLWARCSIFAPAVWSRALSDSEWRELYQEGLQRFPFLVNRLPRRSGYVEQAAGGFKAAWIAGRSRIYGGGVI